MLRTDFAEVALEAKRESLLAGRAGNFPSGHGGPRSSLLARLITPSPRTGQRSGPLPPPAHRHPSSPRANGSGIVWLGRYRSPATDAEPSERPQQRPAPARSTNCGTVTGRTNVNVALFVEGEVLPTEGPILALRLVVHRDVRRYLRLVDQPVQVGSGTLSRVARETFGLDVEALLGAFDHGLGRANFGLADGARRLDVHDDAELHVN